MRDAISCRINGRKMVIDCAPTTSLAALLREDLGLRGVKISCSRAVCGSCTVLIDGCPAASCALFAYHVDGADVLTIEGLSAPAAMPHPIQAAFAAQSAFQCGYCISGMILLTKALLDRNPNPDHATAMEWISANICRCTGYAMVIDAVLDAARRLRESVRHD